MHILIRCFFLGLGILSLSGFSHLFAQDTGRPITNYPQFFETINKDYQQGRITLNQKILYQLYAVKDPGRLPKQLLTTPNTPLKCGTSAFQEARINSYRLSANTKTVLQALSATPVLENEQTYLSKEGKFLVHYTTSGDDSVSVTDNSGSGIPDYVEWVAAAADSSWRHEVANLGYTDPVADSSQPYHVYILNLEYYYGDTIVSDDNSTTFIRIENDFSENFPPNDDPSGHQQGAVKVTMAHELKHAIQYANSAWYDWSNGQSPHSLNWSEMDATLMEEVVYDNVNDYYNYLFSSSSIFINPSNPIPGAYWQVSWFLFFETYYGSQFWVDVWGRIKDVYNEENKADSPRYLNMPTAIRQTLEQNYNSTLSSAFVNSHLWHFASGPGYSSSNFGFEERLNYPNPAVENKNSFFTTDFSSPQPSTSSDSLSGFTATYFKITPPVKASGKVFLEVTNLDPHAGAGIIAYFKDGTTDTRIYTFQKNSQELFDKLFWNWNDIKFIGMVLTNSNSGSAASTALIRIGSKNVDQLTLSQNYPNPFHGYTNIRYTIANNTRVQLNIYDISGRLVYTVRDEEMQPGVYEDEISLDNLASGIYFYRLTTDEESITRKMTLIK